MRQLPYTYVVTLFESFWDCDSIHFLKSHTGNGGVLPVFQSWSDSPHGRLRLNGRSQASFFFPLLYFPSLSPFALWNSVFLFLSTFCLSSHPFPSSILLPLTLLSFCLTTVGLLWEVIRKNSTETRTAAAESKAFNTFYSPTLHYNSKRLGVRGRGGWGRVCRNCWNIFREWCQGKMMLW